VSIFKRETETKFQTTKKQANRRKMLFVCTGCVCHMCVRMSLHRGAEFNTTKYVCTPTKFLCCCAGPLKFKNSRKSNICIPRPRHLVPLFLCSMCASSLFLEPKTKKTNASQTKHKAFSFSFLFFWGGQLKPRIYTQRFKQNKNIIKANTN
jgi:hypothetical protein